MQIEAPKKPQPISGDQIPLIPLDPAEPLVPEPIDPDTLKRARENQASVREEREAERPDYTDI